VPARGCRPATRRPSAGCRSFLTGGRLGSGRRRVSGRRPTDQGVGVSMDHPHPESRRPATVMCVSNPRSAMIRCHSAIGRAHIDSIDEKQDPGPWFGHGGDRSVTTDPSPFLGHRRGARCRTVEPGRDTM